MTDPQDDEDLKLLEMIADWTKQTAELADDHVQQVRQAIAEEDAGAADRLRKPSYPPCPLCGAEVTSYEFNSAGPVLIEFQPCGNKVICEERSRG
jgi:hypothetical protein